MNADITVVKASHLLHFINFLDDAGAPVDNLLKQVNMERAQFSHVDNLIPEAPFWAFLALVAKIQGLADIGFKVTEQLSLDSFGVFGKKIMQAKNLRHALQLFIGDMGEQSNCPPFWLTQAQDSIWFCRLGTQGIKVGQWPIEQHVVSMMIQLVRGFTSPHWLPTRTYLQTGSVVGCHEHPLFVDSDTHLNKAVTAICIPQVLLINPPTINNKPSAIPSSFIAKTIPLACSELVKDVIKQKTDLMPFKADEIAKKLGVSVRQLQRLLQKDGTCFRDLSEQELFKQAKILLRQKDVSVLEISLDLGYLDSANFTRAFKRWSGVSPTQFKSL